ncbi:hypothetical protein QBC38DRAFT_491454 [Podospora fimiseda]|uniref:F-box domain-containing protein n=1 Tax=Podospora fimiseda TaxID=252190 RepID=A0AAN7BF95_9PEZI|nr:hypothetical protein QBC38DRAFT_491454 [Podospora fimiseda]
MDDDALGTFYYHHPAIEPTISHRDLRRIPLDNGKHSWLSSELIADLGLLGTLPNEIVSQILEQIDLPSLTSFRQVNRIAMKILDSLPAYSFIATRFPAILRATILTKAQSWTLQDLYVQLRHLRGPRDKPACTTTIKGKSCKHPAVYLWLLTGKCFCNCCYHAQTPLDTLQVLRHMSMCGLLPFSKPTSQWESPEQLKKHLDSPQIKAILSTIPHCNPIPTIFGRWDPSNYDSDQYEPGEIASIIKDIKSKWPEPLILYDREAVHAKYMPPPKDWCGSRESESHKITCVCEWYFIYYFEGINAHPEGPMYEPSTLRQSLCAVRLGVARNRDSEQWPPRRLPKMCKGLRMRGRMYMNWSGDGDREYFLRGASKEELSEWK